MSRAIPILARDWIGLAYTPLGWVALAAFALPPGLMFATATLVPGTPVSMRLPLQVAAWCLFVTAPVLALRSVTEERRAGTWDTLVASPASAVSIVLGKLGALSIFLLLFALPLVALAGLLAAIARPDFGEFACGLLGVLLAGLAILSSAVAFAALAPGGIAAYLLTIGFWAAWLLVARALPTIVPPEWSAAAFAIDPLRRIDDFVIGILDPANVAFFVAIIALFTATAIDAVAEPTRAGSGQRRVLPRVLALLGAVTLAVSATGLASEPVLRRSVDLTRSRAWTLSERTRALVASLEGDWRIDAIAGGDSIDAVALRQVDEVLARFDGLPTRSGRVVARRIDPVDPLQTGSYDESLERLERLYAKPLAEVRAALETGIGTYEQLATWAGAESNALGALLAQVPTAAEARAAATSMPPAPGAIQTPRTALADDDRAALDQWRAICARLATDHRAFLDELRAESRSSAKAPLGNPSGAAAALESALRAWISQCNAADAALRELRRRDPLPELVLEYLREAPRRTLDMAQRLSAAQDLLARLPELALSEVAAALRAGDAVIVSGPDRAGAIPGWQLLPQAGGGPSSFDRRFRGEEVIAGALRALERGSAPEVIFVHAEGRSMLRPSGDRLDFAAMADALRSVRSSVREWQPTIEPRPLARDGRRQVWVVVPPLRRAGVDPDPRERRLLEAATRLVEEGEPILLAVTPSVLPLVGQTDPWAILAGRLGVEAKTGSTILELSATSERQRVVRGFFEIDGESEHEAARGARSMRTVVSEPVPLVPAPGVEAVPLLEIPVASNRWHEDDWRSAVRRTIEVPESKRLDAPVAVLEAVERRGGGRAVVSGGTGWILSGLADMTGQLGPERVYLRYPGNRELFVGAVGWLADLDGDFGAGSGREVERIPRLSRSTLASLAAIAIAGVPGVSLLAALAVRARRRRG